MTAFVEECRQEWRRLGVPHLLAEEMATDLEADLAEAEADGVSAAEILGESDPRRFAATWAGERGLVSEPVSAPVQGPQERGRRRVWPWVALALLLLAALFVSFTLVSWGSGSGAKVVTPPPRVAVPNVVGLEGCRAERIALAAGFIVQHVPRKRCHDQVVAQRPAPGTVVQRLKPRNTVKLRLRG